MKKLDIKNILIAQIIAMLTFYPIYNILKTDFSSCNLNDFIVGETIFLNYNKQIDILTFLLFVLSFFVYLLILSWFKTHKNSIKRFFLNNHNNYFERETQALSATLLLSGAVISVGIFINYFFNLSLKPFYIAYPVLLTFLFLYWFKFKINKNFLLVNQLLMLLGYVIFIPHLDSSPPHTHQYKIVNTVFCFNKSCCSFI